MSPISVFDVAQYILGKNGPMTTMKLQKLVYYAQAWSLAWGDAPLFEDAIEAWDNGPVVRTLWDRHRGQKHISALPAGNAAAVPASIQDTLDAVLEHYGNLSPDVLSELTHAEQPWRAAHRRGNTTVIEPKALRQYYTGLARELLQETAGSGLFHLKLLLAGVTSQNRHDMIDFRAQGDELL